MKRDIPPEIDLPGALGTLARHEVRFIVIGGIAGNLHGSAMLTSDIDVVYERGRENIRRLAAALAEMDARRRDVPSGVEAPIDERALLAGTNFLLTTRYGRLDCIGETPADRLTYEQLAPTAVRFEIAKDLVVPVASLDELIRMKRAAGRPKDLAAVEHLSALRDEHELGEAAARFRRPRPRRKRRASIGSGTRKP